MFLILERLGLAKLLERMPRLWRHVYTLVVVMTAWVFFRASSLSYASDFIKAMFGFTAAAKGEFSRLLIFRFLHAKVVLALGAALIGCRPDGTFSALAEYKNKLGASFNKISDTFKFAIASISETAFLALVFLYSAASLAADTFNPFIYFRF